MNRSIGPSRPSSCPWNRSLTRFFAALLFTALSASASLAEERRAPIGIAPLEADIQAMQRTLGDIQALVNDRDPDAVEALISPNIGSPHRDAIMAATRSFIGSLPANVRYEIRTDIGRNALVPVGPERMEVQVRGTRVVEGRRGGAGMVSLQLEAVEADGQRRWLLTELRFPGQGTILVGGWPWTETALGALAFTVIGLLLWRWRRRRSRRGSADEVEISETA
jgi:hypothetical protein